MLDFKLISVDSHMTEHPGCFERVQKEFPEKAPRVVENPQGIGKGLYFIMEGLEPMHVGFFALGNVVEKPHGRKQMLVYSKTEEFKNIVTQWRENYRYEDHKEHWSAPEYLEALERDGVDIALIYASWARYNYHLDDAKLQRSLFRSYNEWMFDFCSYNPKQLFFGRWSPSSTSTSPARTWSNTPGVAARPCTCRPPSSAAATTRSSTRSCGPSRRIWTCRSPFMPTRARAGR